MYRILLAFAMMLMLGAPVLALSPEYQSKFRNVWITRQLQLGSPYLNAGPSSLTPQIILKGTPGTGTTLDTTILWTVPAAARTITIPDAGGNSNVLLTTGNVNGQVAKARVFSVDIGPGTAVPNSTTYKFVIAPARAGTITKISVAANVVPIGGTNTLKVQKNAGNTMLSTATFDPTTISAANTSQALTLTATGADLTLNATDTIYIEYNSGVQTTAAIAPTVSVEYLPNDY